MRRPLPGKIFSTLGLTLLTLTGCAPAPHAVSQPAALPPVAPVAATWSTAKPGPVTTGKKPAAKKPAPLARGAQARKIVATAMNSVGKHGPYRGTVTVSDGKQTLPWGVCELAPPSASHCAAFGTFGKALAESITIGRQTWTWNEYTGWAISWPEYAVGMPEAIPQAKDIVRATEVRSKNPKLRTFVLVVKKVPAGTRVTVVVDHQGRLSKLIVTAKGDTTSIGYTYDPKIRVAPPV